MNVEVRSGVPHAAFGLGWAWDWELEVGTAIAMVVRHPAYRVVLCADWATGRTLAKLAPAAARAGVVLEPRPRRGGGWDIEVRAA
jgi:hypothetical protein